MSTITCKKCEGIGMIRRKKNVFSDCLQCMKKNMAVCYKCEKIKNKSHFKECDKCFGTGILMYDEKKKLIYRTNFL
mgnify:CR=1 FL=1|tara:strand:- start:704 stop:931 length:228 start_codon:yes stop_codon:yes gene_type:complete